VLRHTTAMDLLQRGVEQSVIALWLGHESIETTQIYLDAEFLRICLKPSGARSAKHTARPRFSVSSVPLPPILPDQPRAERPAFVWRLHRPHEGVSWITRKARIRAPSIASARS
jgi:hypothetical protein